jgi:transcriptional regulator with XRE-family HTH domain
MTGNAKPWAERIRAERVARGLSQRKAAEQLCRIVGRDSSEVENMLRRWKAWEAGDNKPVDDNASGLAKMFNTVTAALFPPEPEANDGGLALLSETGLDTLEIVSRLQASDINQATIDGLRITVDKLCSEYSYMPPRELIVEGRQWLRRIVEMNGGRLTFAQRAETLELAGWLTLLVGCLEYDLGDRNRAEATRQAAMRIGTEIGHGGIIGWAYEMSSWFALTTGNYRGVLAAAEAGVEAARGHSVAVQLIAQEAKARARMRDTRGMNDALERGRELLETMPYPENIENHFVVDPAKFDFYAMDCYRKSGEDRLAVNVANEVIRVGTDFDGSERAPMRIAEARVTLGVAAARAGDLDEALSYGAQALNGDRKSMPSLVMVTKDLAGVLAERYKDEPDAREYLDRLNVIRADTYGR